MITKAQLEEFSRNLKTNTTVVAREYLQLVFLQKFYELEGSEEVFFKGGTAIRFLFEGFRFSEDLDFNCRSSRQVADHLIFQAVKRVKDILFGLEVKEKKSLAGKSYLLTLPKGMVDFPVFVRLDLSFRERPLQEQKGIIKTKLPVIFTSFVRYLGGEEILAEKVRAILTRGRARDLFDMWFLLNKGFELNESFIQAKMGYYPEVDFSWQKVWQKIEDYNFAEFKKDLSPFLALDKRAKINETFEIIKIQLGQKIKGKRK